MPRLLCFRSIFKFQLILFAAIFDETRLNLSDTFQLYWGGGHFNISERNDTNEQY